MFNTHHLEPFIIFLFFALLEITQSVAKLCHMIHWSDWNVKLEDQVLI